MKVLVDANVLFPTVQRQLVLGCAAQGLLTPLWSERIVQEWHHAAARAGSAIEAAALGEIARTRAAFPEASQPPRPDIEAGLWLPDPDDRHVLAAAVAGHADVILTQNSKDFPRGILAAHGVSRAHPDRFFAGLLDASQAAVTLVAGAILTEATQLSGQPWTAQSLFRKARLPMFAKALSRVISA